MVNFYIFNEKKDSCVVWFEDKDSLKIENGVETQTEREAILPLVLQSKNAFQ
jgi:hypothetical protein